MQFIKDSIAELKRVVWPSREKVVSSIWVVLISTVIFAAFFWGVDTAVTQGLTFLTSL
jgi:preprotein translocase subunit SecE